MSIFDAYGCFKATVPQLKHYKRKAKRIAASLFPHKKKKKGKGKMAIQNKTFHQDIHSETYNDKNSKPQQKHRLGKILTGGGVGGGA